MYLEGLVGLRCATHVAADHVAFAPCKGFSPMAYKKKSDVSRAVGVCEAALGLLSEDRAG
jgi:hypothetical protein